MHSTQSNIFIPKNVLLSVHITFFYFKLFCLYNHYAQYTHELISIIRSVSLLPAYDVVNKVKYRFRLSLCVKPEDGEIQRTARL